jgi:hypothetical protein
MGLTARKSLRLDDTGLVGLFEEEEAMWTKTAKEAYDYTADFVKGAGEPVRPDDLIPILVPVLEVTDTLRTFLSEHRLSQKYWYTWFGELTIDRVWDEFDEEDE